MPSYLGQLGTLPRAGGSPGGRLWPEASPEPPLLSCSTSLEALKSLLSTTGHWRDFAHLELQGSWELFTTIHTYPKGVGLLARYGGARAGQGSLLQATPIQGAIWTASTGHGPLPPVTGTHSEPVDAASSPRPHPGL